MFYSLFTIYLLKSNILETTIIIIYKVFYWRRGESESSIRLINQKSVSNKLITCFCFCFFVFGLSSEIYSTRSNNLQKSMYKLPYISSNLTQLNSLNFHSHLSNSRCTLVHLQFNFNGFSLSSAKVWANRNTAIFFYSRHKNMTSIQKGNYSDFEVILTLLQIL